LLPARNAADASPARACSFLRRGLVAGVTAAPAGASVKFSGLFGPAGTLAFELAVPMPSFRRVTL
jgi:hypothetical protein